MAHGAPQRVPKRAPKRRGLVLVALLAAVSATALLVFWRTRGPLGLAGSGAGLLAGGAISAIAQVLRRRARTAEGTKVLPAMMLATFSGFALFLLLVGLVAAFFKELSVPVLLSALGVHLAVLFHESFSRDT